MIIWAKGAGYVPRPAVRAVAQSSQSPKGGVELFAAATCERHVEDSLIADQVSGRIRSAADLRRRRGFERG